MFTPGVQRKMWDGHSPWGEGCGTGEGPVPRRKDGLGRLIFSKILRRRAQFDIGDCRFQKPASGTFRRVSAYDDGSEVNPMYCAYCGTQATLEEKFCNKCGKPLASAAASGATAIPVPPPQASTAQPGIPSPSVGFARPSRMARHLSTLAVLWLIFSLLRLIPALALLGFSHMHFPFMFMPVPGPMRLFLAPFLGGIGLLLSGFAIAGAIAGWGLMARYPWARMLAIVLGCISLIHFPFGTALGVYTLWVLVPEGTDAEYRRLARAN